MTGISAAIVWPLLLIYYGELDDPVGSRIQTLALSAALGVVNAGIGVAVHQAVLFLVRKLPPHRADNGQLADATR